MLLIVDKDTTLTNKFVKFALLDVETALQVLLEVVKPVPKVTTYSKEAVYNNAHPHTMDSTSTAKLAQLDAMFAQMQPHARSVRSESSTREFVFQHAHQVNINFQDNVSIAHQLAQSVLAQPTKNVYNVMTDTY